MTELFRARPVSARDLRAGDLFASVFTVKRIRSEWVPKVVVGHVANESGPTEVEISGRTLDAGCIILLARAQEPLSVGDVVRPVEASDCEQGEVVGFARNGDVLVDWGVLPGSYGARRGPRTLERMS